MLLKPGEGKNVAGSASPPWIHHEEHRCSMDPPPEEAPISPSRWGRRARVENTTVQLPSIWRRTL
jgi:hypothetical protein